MTESLNLPDYREMLESILHDLRDALNEPYATDQNKMFMVEHLMSRYKFFLENPKAFEAAKRIVAMAKGEMKQKRV